MQHASHAAPSSVASYLGTLSPSPEAGLALPAAVVRQLTSRANLPAFSHRCNKNTATHTQTHTADLRLKPLANG